MGPFFFAATFWGTNFVVFVSCRLFLLLSDELSVLKNAFIGRAFLLGCDTFVETASCLDDNWPFLFVTEVWGTFVVVFVPGCLPKLFCLDEVEPAALKYVFMLRTFLWGWAALVGLSCSDNSRLYEQTESSNRTETAMWSLKDGGVYICVVADVPNCESNAFCDASMIPPPWKEMGWNRPLAVAAQSEAASLLESWQYRPSQPPQRKELTSPFWRCPNNDLSMRV